MGSAGAGPYGAGISSPGSASLVKRYIGQAIIVVGDLPKSRAAGALAESWRGEAMSVGDNDLSGMMPLLIEGAFRYFGRTTSAPAQIVFGEEKLTKLRLAK